MALPFLNAVQAAHPAFEPSVATLRPAGVTVLYGPDVLELHAPGQGAGLVETFPWKRALDTLDQRTRAETS